MSAIRAELVCKKLKGMRFDIDALRALTEDNEPSITENEEHMTLAERRLERTINRAIDINLLLSTVHQISG